MSGLTDTKYQNMEQEFKNLGHEEKKQKIINIMEYIQDKVDFAGGMKDFILSSGDISDTFLDNMYQLIMKTAVDTAQTQSDQKAQNMLDYIQNMILEHQQIDEKEHQEADCLLDQI
ncbi:hypothetical protein K9M48_00260 [Candidatus Gracilibacteria bacterium]|nr:hypothetical protein [Candidatus Gracilibacteria bacterium]